MAKITVIQLFKNIRLLVEQSKQELYAVANVTLTETNFHIGRNIIEFEQQGSTRAAYAKETLIKLSGRLTSVLGKGFSVDNLENMRKFYIVYKDEYFKYIIKNQISEPVARKLSLSPFQLSWTHFVMLLNFASKYKVYFPEKQILKLIRDE